MSSVRFDRLQAGLLLIFAGLADIVSWEHTQAPRAAGSLLTIGLETDPEPHLSSHASGEGLVPMASAVVQVTSATEGEIAIVRCNGHDYTHDVGEDETPTTVRAALLASITAGETGAVTPTATSTDKITLTAAVLGGLRMLACSGAVELVEDSAVLADAGVLVRTGTRVCEVVVEAFSRGREPRNGASEIIAGALDRLQSVAYSQILASYGVKRWGIGTPLKLDALAGGSWESRRRLPFTVAVQSVHVEPVDLIETVTTTIAQSA